jgi:hypothetical protein
MLLSESIVLVPVDVIETLLIGVSILFMTCLEDTVVVLIFVHSMILVINWVVLVAAATSLDWIVL